MHDAVVVGAGPNGLVAANLLADAGWEVLVLEATDTPGGAVRTAEIAAPGFHSDVFSSFYPLGAASPVLRALHLERHGLRWRHAPHVLGHAFGDGRAAVLSRDIEETAASVDAFAPGDGDAWRRLYDDWRRLGPDVIDAIMRPFPPVRPGLRLARSLGVADGFRLARFGLLPVRRFVEEEFTGEGARMLVAGSALHTDLSPGGAGSAVFGWLLAMLGQDVGFPVPEGGAARLVDSLVSRLRAAGGSIRCGAPVSGVVVREGRAVGVDTADGERLPVAHAVLADVPAPVLYRDLVGPAHLPPRLLADLERFQWDNATLKVDWALSGPIPWVAEGLRGAGTVHLGADLDGLTSYSASLTTGQLPRRPFLLMGQMTTTDPTRSPAGTEAAWAYTHLPRRESWTARTIDRHVERVETVVEQHAPGFGALVTGRYVQGPDRLQAANPSLVGGSINGGTAALHQQLLFRPVPGLARAETPVDGLYLASSSAHPGGGVHGAPGANAARAALLRRHPAGRFAAAGLRRLSRRILS